MREKGQSVDHERRIKQELYQRILAVLGEPPEDAPVYPLPDCPVSDSMKLSICSPYLVVVYHERIGLHPRDFHHYSTPIMVEGDWKVTVMTKTPVNVFGLKEPVIVVEGVVRNATVAGITTRFALYSDGHEQTFDSYLTWNREGRTEVCANFSQFFRIGKTPVNWKKVAEAVETSPLIPSSRYRTSFPPLTRPLAIRGKGARD